MTNIMQLLQIFWLHIHDVNLLFPHIPKVFSWLEIWWLWRPFEYWTDCLRWLCDMVHYPAWISITRYVIFSPNRPFAGTLTDRKSDQSYRWIRHFVWQTNQTGEQINMGGLKLEKWCVLTSFHSWNKINYNVHSCLFRALSKYEKMICSHAAWTEALQRSVTTH